MKSRLDEVMGPVMDEPAFRTASGEVISRQTWLDRSHAHTASVLVFASCECGWSVPCSTPTEAAEVAFNHQYLKVGYPLMALNPSEAGDA